MELGNSYLVFVLIYAINNLLILSINRESRDQRNLHAEKLKAFQKVLPKAKKVFELYWCILR